LANYLCFCQNISDERFGQIKVDDFFPKSSILSNDDDAVVLSDIGSSEFIGNNSGDFTILFRHHKKILLKKNTAFDKATIRALLYRGNYSTEANLDDIEAATYNLENGKIITTKLNKENIIKEKYDRLFVTKKFTMPDIKEGCIIEYSYTLKRKTINCTPGNFKMTAPHYGHNIKLLSLQCTTIW